MNTKKIDRYRLFFYFSLIFQCVSFVWVLWDQSEHERQMFLGYSHSRWLIILFFFSLIALSLFLIINKHPRVAWERMQVVAKHKIEQWLQDITFILFLLITFIILYSLFSSVRWELPLARVLPLFLYGVAQTLLILIFKPLFIKPPWSSISEKWKTLIQRLSVLIEYAYNALVSSCKGKRFLIPMLIFAGPLLFSPSFQSRIPNGFSGFYILMSELLKNNHFLLPETVPFYGPGGTPFAYPPLGIYLMSFFTNILSFPIFSYLRFSPPLFMLLSLIPMSLLAWEWTKSRTASILAPLLIASSQSVFSVQGTSGGIVRGLAYLLAMLAIYFFWKAVTTTKLKYIFFAGICYAFTGLTHLGYLQFAALFAIATLISHYKKNSTWKVTLYVGLLSVILMSPWVILMLRRFGWLVFQGAFQSHGNDSFLVFFSTPERFISWLSHALNGLIKMKWVWGMVIIGILFSLSMRFFELPLWFALTLIFMSEGDRFSITVAGLLLGITFQGLSISFQKLSSSKKGLTAAITSSLFLAIILYQGWSVIPVRNAPVISQDSLELADFIRHKSLPESKYLIVASAEEAEWYPYLFRRTPVAASWGGEWKGTYSEHLGYLIQILYCQELQSANCLEELQKQLPEKPDLLIIHKTDHQLTEEVTELFKWDLFYENNTYIVWKRN